VAALPGKGIILRALMGANSDGPLTVAGEDDAVMIDLESMEPMKIEGPVGGQGKHVSIHASFDGRTYAGIPKGYGPVAYARVRLAGKKTEVREFSSTSNAVRYAWPTADGTLIFVTGHGLFGPDLGEIPAKWFEGSTLMPTVDPRYFIAARALRDERLQKHVCHLHFCTTGERQIVHTLVGLEELATIASDWQTTFTQQVDAGHERVHYIPWANVIVTLPFDNQEIDVRRYDLMKELESSGVEYLFVDSIPPFEAVRGDTLRYPIAVKSKSAAITYRLETGPDGASVSEDGIVTWNIPRETADAATQFIVAIKNGAGKEVLHSFSVRLKDSVTIVESPK
jgi:hypothetical protein